MPPAVLCSLVWERGLSHQLGVGFGAALCLHLLVTGFHSFSALQWLSLLVFSFLPNHKKMEQENFTISSRAPDTLNEHQFWYKKSAVHHLTLHC